MIVGSQINIPIAGSYELYIVESLENEQNTLVLVQRVLAVGGAVLVGALMIIAWFSARQVVRPVQTASAIAARLASGQLRSEEHTSELQSRGHLVCRLL